MATNPDALIAGLLNGTGFGRTVGDVAQQNYQNQGLQQQNQIGALALAGAQEQQAKAQQYQGFVDDYSRDPTPQKLLNGILRFPDQYKQLKEVHDSKDLAAQTADLSYWSQVNSALGAGKTDLAITNIANRIDAEKKAGLDTSVDEQYLEGLKAGDPGTVNALKAASLAGIAIATGTDQFAKSYGVVADKTDGYTLRPGDKRYDTTGKLIASAPFAPEYKSVGPGESLYDVTEGGGPTSSGGAAGGGDVSRLINSDAGGGYVPDSVKTLGQFVTYGKAMNARGAKSSSAGTYQINGSTMAEFAPRVLGPDWKNVPFNADTQDKVGEGIFNWAKTQPNPAEALRKRWVSLSPQAAATLVQGSWNEAKGPIAQGETGGGPQASAAGGGPRLVAQGAPKPNYRLLTPDENRAAGLDPNVRYQQSPTGEITALGGQAKSQGQLKPIPQSVGKEIITNRSTLRQIDNAIAELDKYPGAVGPGTGMFGDYVTNNLTDPKGVTARAAIGKIAGQIIHDVSGAAVTLSEEPRFKPYVPQVTDTPQVAKTKLLQLRNLATGVLSDYYDQYSEDQGYKPFGSPAKHAAEGAAAVPKPAPANGGWGQARVVR